MKKMFLVFLFSLMAAASFSQRVRANGYDSYMFDDGFESGYDPITFLVGTVNGGKQWGCRAGIHDATNLCFEVQYLHQTTQIRYTYQLGPSSSVKSESPTLAIDCFMIDSYGRLHSISEKVEGYAGLFFWCSAFADK